MRWNSQVNYSSPPIPPTFLYTQGNSSGCNSACQKQQYYNHPPAGGSGNGPYFTSQGGLTAVVFTGHIIDNLQHLLLTFRIPIELL